MSETSSAHRKLLLVNPNTSESMTNGLKPIVDSILSLHKHVEVDFFTAPTSASGSPGAIPSINSPNDAYQSALYCLPHLQPLIARNQYDGYLVACYSDHPLVEMLASVKGGRRKHVIGIFEASVMTSLGIGNFGIVTTGKIWEEALSKGVDRFLGIRTGASSTKFLGVASTGLTAGELHNLDASTVREKIRMATEELVREHEGVQAICVGCAGMVGFDDAIRAGIRSVLGEVGDDIRIVDGVAAGLQWLISTCRL
ncbi:Asp/Glu/hydantoin racemase [Lyophyllum atratum]|nr:Asp/Glu/hydantoin racemase [Lyophyllum atratum]